MGTVRFVLMVFPRAVWSVYVRHTVYREWVHRPPLSWDSRCTTCSSRRLVHLPRCVLMEQCVCVLCVWLCLLKLVHVSRR